MEEMSKEGMCFFLLLFFNNIIILLFCYFLLFCEFSVSNFRQKFVKYSERFFFTFKVAWNFFFSI